MENHRRRCLALISDPQSPLRLETILDTVSAAVTMKIMPTRKNEDLRRFLIHIKEMQMKPEDFNTVNVISKGHCVVKLVRHRKSQKLYAVKVMNKSRIIEQNQTKLLLQERNAMICANSHWLIQLHFAFQDKFFLYMVMDYMPGSDLDNLIIRHRMTEDDVRFYTAEMVLAVDAFHSLGYVHCNIKLENFLVDCDGHLRLYNFGMCRKMDSRGWMPVIFGTWKNSVPEITTTRRCKQNFGLETDWWAVGVCTRKLIADLKLKIKLNDEMTRQNPKDITFYEQANDFILFLSSYRKSCLGCNSVNKIKSHPFFKNDKWSWDTIRETRAPIVPLFGREIDTRHFSLESLNSVMLKAPTHFEEELNFIGFTFLGEEHEHSKLNELQQNLEQKQAACEDMEAELTVTKLIVEYNKKAQKDLEQRLKEEQASKLQLEGQLLELEKQNAELTEWNTTLDQQYQQALMELSKTPDGELKYLKQEVLPPTQMTLEDEVERETILQRQTFHINEDECREQQELKSVSVGEGSGSIHYKGHEFVVCIYRVPRKCEYCIKPLWKLFKALKCRKCHLRCHKHHMGGNKEVITPCTGPTTLNNLTPVEDSLHLMKACRQESEDLTGKLQEEVADPDPASFQLKSAVSRPPVSHLPQPQKDQRQIMSQSAQLGTGAQTGRKMESQRAEMLALISYPESPLKLEMFLDIMSAFLSHEALRSKLASRHKKVMNVISKIQMKPGDFKTLEVIGEGGFGRVKLVRHRRSQKVYAIKVMNKCKIIEHNHTDLVLQERNAMICANSPWLIKLHFAFHDKCHIYLVMDFIPASDLCRRLQKYSITQHDVRFYAAEIVLAVDTFHSLGYLHCDIKLENFLVDCDGHLRLCDYGMCHKMDSHGQAHISKILGTPEYMAPDLLRRGERRFGREIDWWAVGVCILKMIRGCVKQTSVNHQFLLEGQNLIKSLMASRKSCLGCNGVDKIKEHPFFKNDKWSWDTIREMRAPVVPLFSSEVDTRHFKGAVKAAGWMQKLCRPKAFKGNHLIFAGFTYLGEDHEQANLQSKLHELQKSLEQKQAVCEDTEAELTVTKQIVEYMKKAQQDLEQKLKEEQASKLQMEGRLLELEKQNAELTKWNTTLDQQYQQALMELSKTPNELKYSTKEVLSSTQMTLEDQLKCETILQRQLQEEAADSEPTSCQLKSAVSRPPVSDLHQPQKDQRQKISQNAQLDTGAQTEKLQAGMKNSGSCISSENLT